MLQFITAYQAGLLFERGKYSRLLGPGTYWVWPAETVLVFDLARPFIPPVELNILLKDPRLKDSLEVVEVKDEEIVLQYENGLLKQVLPPGRYAYWKGIIDYTFVKADLSQIDIPGSFGRETLGSKPMAPYVRSYTLESYERGLLFVDGKYIKPLESGTYYWWKNNTSIQVAKVDIRTQQLEITGQEILTRDKAALRINAWARYRASDVEKAVRLNKEYDRQLYVAFQLTLREYIGGLSLDELLEKKEAINTYILETIGPAAEALGIEVSGFGIRDIILPGDVKEIMNQVLVAEKKAQANTIMRREETASTRSLLNTARLMEDNPMLYKLKEMEYVEKITEKITHLNVSTGGALADQLKQLFVPGTSNK